MRPDDPALAAVNATDAAREAAARPPAPTFRDDDLHGPAGDWVRLWAPHTEASPVSVYAVALTSCGALLGRGPHSVFGNTTHHARLFPLLIGPSGAGRKGTALSLGARVLLAHVDPDFNSVRVVSGLSSGEGLIAEVRDARPPTIDEHSGKTIDPGDKGVLDKRLLVIEGEMASGLESMTREGNRLSAVIRDAWDGSDLRSLVKRDPQRATNPHISIIGAITATELRKLLTKTALANGLSNRLLPIWCERARLLPEDSQPDQRDVTRVAHLIATRLDTARVIGATRWTPAAAEQWATEYDQLTIIADPSPIIRGLLERGAPYVRRIALTLALLDGSRDIDTDHLHAALVLWRFAADTWRHVYHDGTTRSDLADKLLIALTEAGAEGLTRTTIRDHVVRSGDVPAERITAALTELSAAGLAIHRMIPTAGRPSECWYHARYVGNLSEGKVENPPSTPATEGSASFNPFPTAARSVGPHPAAEPLDDGYWQSLALDDAA